jgi:hypothetical protein
LNKGSFATCDQQRKFEQCIFENPLLLNDSDDGLSFMESDTTGSMEMNSLVFGETNDLILSAMSTDDSSVLVGENNSEGLLSTTSTGDSSVSVGENNSDGLLLSTTSTGDSSVFAGIKPSPRKAVGIKKYFSGDLNSPVETEDEEDVAIEVVHMDPHMDKKQSPASKHVSGISKWFTKKQKQLGLSKNTREQPVAHAHTPIQAREEDGLQVRQAFLSDESRQSVEEKEDESVDQSISDVSSVSASIQQLQGADRILESFPKNQSYPRSTGEHESLPDGVSHEESSSRKELFVRSYWSELFDKYDPFAEKDEETIEPIISPMEHNSDQDWESKMNQIILFNSADSSKSPINLAASSTLSEVLDKYKPIGLPYVDTTSNDQTSKTSHKEFPQLVTVKSKSAVGPFDLAASNIRVANDVTKEEELLASNNLLEDPGLTDNVALIKTRGSNRMSSNGIVDAVDSYEKNSSENYETIDGTEVELASQIPEISASMKSGGVFETTDASDGENFEVIISNSCASSNAKEANIILDTFSANERKSVGLEADGKNAASIEKFEGAKSAMDMERTEFKSTLKSKKRFEKIAISNVNVKQSQREEKDDELGFSVHLMDPTNRGSIDNSSYVEHDADQVDIESNLPVRAEYDEVGLFTFDSSNDGRKSRRGTLSRNRSTFRSNQWRCSRTTVTRDRYICIIVFALCVMTLVIAFSVAFVRPDNKIAVSSLQDGRFPADSPTEAPMSSNIFVEKPTSFVPSFSPSNWPSTGHPSFRPSLFPTSAPTKNLSRNPTLTPTSTPTSQRSSVPSSSPSYRPTILSSQPPSDAPSSSPSYSASQRPTIMSSSTPSSTFSTKPSIVSSSAPSIAFSVSPSITLSLPPSSPPTIASSSAPTISLSDFPTVFASEMPTQVFSEAPTLRETQVPSGSPSTFAWPSASPTSDAKAHIVEVAAMLSLSVPTDPRSPLYRSLDWAAMHAKSRTPTLQRVGLAAFYYATNGENWNEQFDFLSVDDECNWSVPIDRSVKGVLCNTDGTVAILALCKYSANTYSTPNYSRY